MMRPIRARTSIGLAVTLAFVLVGGDILTSEITRTLQLLGTDSVRRLEPAHVRLRP
jgi:hypothetical protein